MPTEKALALVKKLNVTPEDNDTSKRLSQQAAQKRAELAKLGGGAFAGAFQTGKNGLEAARIEIAPHVDDADRDVDLGVDDALLGEMLHHAPGGELVVFRVAQAARDRLEGLDELGEIGEAVEGFGFRQREAMRVVARAELDEGGREDGAFEVKVKLSLGQAADEVANVAHL